MRGECGVWSEEWEGSVEGEVGEECGGRLQHRLSVDSITQLYRSYLGIMTRL